MVTLDHNCPSKPCSTPDRSRRSDILRQTPTPRGSDPMNGIVMRRSVAAVVAAGLITGGAAMASPAQARPAPDSGPAVPAGAAGDVPVNAEVASVDAAAAFTPKAISWGTCTEKA